MKKEEIRNLIDELNKATQKYDEGNPILSDSVWDEKYFKLKNLEEESGIYYPDSPTQAISYTVLNNLKKVKHKYPMLSLDKTQNWDEFLKYFVNYDVIGMLKLDGLTCALTYEDGYLVAAETRGDGYEGEDILHNALVIPSIPKRINYNKTLIVHGEILITTYDFEYFKNEYSNPRNFAAGSLRLLDSAECAKRMLQFLAWNVVEGFEDTNSFLQKIIRLEKLGFVSVPWTSSFDWDAKEFLIKVAEEEGYPIDGLVGRYDDITYGESLGATEHHSRAAYAYKMEDKTYTSYLKNIEFTMGRTGILTPVAIFDPIEIEGSICERASLHNLTCLKDILYIPYKGQRVEVYKAQMIIPQIASGGIAESSADMDNLRINIPKICPYCGEKLIIDCENNSEILKCINKGCNGLLLNQLIHFCSDKALNIKGLSAATLEKLMDWGWLEKKSDIFNLWQKRSEWINKPGFGTKSVDKILDAIENSRDCELEKFIVSIGIPLIGEAAAKEISKVYKTWNNFIFAVEEKEDFSKLKDFGPKMNEAILSYNYKAVYDYKKYLRIQDKKEEKQISNSMENQNFVITGKLNNFSNRDKLKELIESLGGKVSSSISSNTNYLINNDITSTSSKNKAALEKNIPIITEEELIKKFNLTF